MANKLTGWSGPRVDDLAGIQKICDEVKSKLEEWTGKTYVDYKAVLYRSQLETGVNYVIKVYCGVEDYIHLCLVRRSPEGYLRVLHVEQQRMKESPLFTF
ncbi:leukocyte cysteine proteinase inhibitor 1-like [Clinocottus analis]|uniref:leukocyte cysteine proteinase inhibitor 1-like n=1 Tax=Clinocottus analis TaxID=304258 RepID=UPI0035C123AE